MKKILFTTFILALTPLGFAFADASTTPDVTPPVITAPADQTFATTTFPASPTLVLATATDNTDPAPIITYSPTSFPVGTTTVTWTATDASGNFATTTSDVGIFDATPVPPPTPSDQVTITIRGSAGQVFSGIVQLPDLSAADVSVFPTNSTTSVAIPARSLLSVLVSLDATSSSFDITSLSYSSAFNSFLLNCIAIPSASTTPDCFNWTDAVNGSYPQVGIDHQILHNGDVVYVFFGPSHQTVLSGSSFVAGEPFTATAEQYDLSSGVYVPLPGVTLGVGTPNPDFSFTELATSSVDSNGQAIFTINATGTFQVGIKEDFYFPTTPVTVTEAPPVTPPGGGGGGGGGGVSHSTLNIPSALAYLSSQQHSDGSYDSPDPSFYSDWVAIAFAAADPGSAKTELKNYLASTTPAMMSITDYERHAMALEAAGINPYSGSPVDYINPIVASYDGTQIGDPNLDTDDIFAIFPLLFAGYLPSDPMIEKEILHIIAVQKPDGSWDESPDMTAAAILAIGPFFKTAGYVNATTNAAIYLATKEQSDGGWNSIDSTSWIQTAINAIPVDLNHPIWWISSSGHVPNDAIASAQQSDGAVRPATDPVNTRVWSTAYAVVAASGQSWWIVLHPFAKQTPAPIPSGNTRGGASGDSSGGLVLGASTSTTVASTSTSETATSTSTGRISPSILDGVSTSTVPHNAPKKILRKQKVLPLPPTVSDQGEKRAAQAAAAAVASPNLMSTAMHAVFRFLSKLFSFF